MYNQYKPSSFQESKYLGGDIEHTHLVKGLDYSLLTKSRSDIYEKDVKTSELVEINLASTVSEAFMSLPFETERILLFRIRLRRTTI